MTSFSLRPVVRRVVNTGSNSFRSVWQAGFYALGRLQPVSVRKMTSTGGQRVVVIAPHPDDEVLSCGGTIQRHLEAGDTVCVVFVTDGRRSTAMNLQPEEMAQIRQDEAAAASEACGFDMEWLGLFEGGWEAEALCSALAARYHADPPDLVYSPSRIDFHPDHILTADAVAAWLADLPNMVVRIYAAQVPLTTRLTNLVADVSDFEKLLRGTTAFYKSQAGNVARMIRLRQYTAARCRTGRLAEPFLEISGARYRALNAAARQAPEMFVGLRHWAFTDPIAYLRGSSLRSILKEHVCES